MRSNTKEFNIINNWLGWGEPANGLWFIGVEEGGTWKCQTSGELEESRKLINKNAGNTYTSYPNKQTRGNVNWPIAVVTAKISSLVSNAGFNWRDYREKKLWLNESKVFNGNLLSLGKASLNLSDWPNGYKDLFGYTAEEYCSYYENVSTHRYKLFNDFVSKHRPQAIVCFGMSHWDDFKKVFLSSDMATTYPDFKTVIYERDKVILTRHFSNGMPDATVEFIAKQLKKWDVSI